MDRMSFLPMIGSSSWQRLCAFKNSSGQHLVFQERNNQILLLLQKGAVHGLILASTAQHLDTEALNKITSDYSCVFLKATKEHTYSPASTDRQKTLF